MSGSDEKTRGQVRVRRGGVLAAAGLLSAALLVPPGGAPAHADPTPVIAKGDVLISNHSFEEGLAEWSLSDGNGDSAGAACEDALSISTDWSTDGAQALAIDAIGGCEQAGALSEVTEVQPGQQYTVWADVTGEGQAWLGLHWVDGDGEVIDEAGERGQVQGERLRVAALAPEGAAAVRVEVGATGSVNADNVLISAEYTVLADQITNRASYLGSTAGVDENGRAVTYAVATAQPAVGAVMTVTDILTDEVTRVVRLTGATGAWGIKQNPVTGTVYVGTYGAGALWLYTPGEEEAVNVGRPDIPAWSFAYQMDFDEEGNAYGGGWGEPTDGYPGASVYTFTEGEGFTGVLGDLPLVDDAYYTRAVGYDEVSRTVFAGTGTQMHLFGCGIDDGECVDLTSLFSEELQERPWVYGLRAGGGYVMAWAGDGASTGNDALLVLQVDRDDSGELQVDVVDEIAEVVFNGSTPVVDDHIYYTKANMNEAGNPLFSYNVVTGEETRLDAPTGIFSRSWDVIDLDHPDWPGPSVVGWNSGGIQVKYNIETGNLESNAAENIPDVALQVNSLATGEDGRVYSAGYLTGGIGKAVPMRDDQHQTFPLGGQAEHMLAHDGRVYQGIYPGGTINSFTADELADGSQPRIDCTIGAGQNRPYALHSSGDRIYFGSQAGEGQDRGAFGWFDSTTGECATIDGPIGHQSINSVTSSAGKVFGAGNIFYSWDGLPLQDEATLMVFDEASEEIQEIEPPVDDLRSINAVVTAADGTVWLYAEGWLLAMDPDTLEWTQTEEVFPDHKPGERIAGNYARMVAGTGGTIYGNAAGRVFGFDPDQAADTGSVAEAVDVLYDGAGAHLTLDDYDNVYVSHGITDLLRIVPESAGQTGGITALRSTLEDYIDSGDVAGPIARQLTQHAEQAERHLEAERTTPATRALEQFITDLDDPRRPDTLSDRARDDLRNQATAILDGLV